MYKVVNFITKESVTPSNLIFADGTIPWEIIMDIGEIRTRINGDYFRKAPPQVSKYLPFMPVKDHSAFVSMNEGATPLIKSRSIGPRLGVDLYFKQESRNPTGSFKDRGSAVELTVARELGAKAIAVASTGNMAASCACYAAAANIPCFIFVPEGTPSSKLSQAISFGGRIVQVKGTYNDAAQLAETVARDLDFYLAGDYAFRIEGQKTAAFELVDQLFFQTPSLVLVPIGCGTNLAAYWKGFQEYKELGVIDELPQIIGTQAEGAQAVVNSFRKGAMSIEPLKRISTIASAIAIAHPIDGLKALDAIYGSKGSAMGVSDREILEAQYLMSREEGIFIEASGATSLAALIQLCKAGTPPEGKVVCVLTGDGLKDPAPMLRMAIKPPTIHPTVDEFTALYDSAFFEGKTVAFVERDTVLFAKSPTSDEIARVLMQSFEGRWSSARISAISDRVQKFLLKGKPVTFSDLQDIIQDVMEAMAKEPVLRVIDFEVTTGMDRKPQGSVKVALKGETRSADATGTGPVDAVINALKEACEGELSFSLSHFEVAIRSQGTDAVVLVEMKLSADGVTSVGKGTSPDVIQASIEAFEHAYNTLHY